MVPWRHFPSGSWRNLAQSSRGELLSPLGRHLEAGIRPFIEVWKLHILNLHEKMNSFMVPLMKFCFRVPTFIQFRLSAGCSKRPNVWTKKNMQKPCIQYLTLWTFDWFLLSLHFRSARGFMHMKIRRDPESREFRLSDFERRFMTVSQMAHHYTRNRLPIKGAEHMCLKTPVKGQLL